MLTLEEIIQDVKDSLVVDKENDLYTCTALAGEVGEYCNFIKKENRTDGFRFKYWQECEDEQMDMLYYVAMSLVTRDVKYEKAWHRKMNHNELKYNRRVKDRPFTCDCEDCEAKRKEIQK